MIESKLKVLSSACRSVGQYWFSIRVAFAGCKELQYST